MMTGLEQTFQAMAAGSWRAAILVALLCALRWLVGKYLSRQVLALFWVGIALVALAPFAVVPVIGGAPALGTWQSITLVDTNVDNPRRTVRLSFLSGG